MKLKTKEPTPTDPTRPYPEGIAWDEVESLLARVARLEGLVQTLLDEDPNEQITDNGSTVLCAWRYDARRVLEEK